MMRNVHVFQILNKFFSYFECVGSLAFTACANVGTVMMRHVILEAGMDSDLP